MDDPTGTVVQILHGAGGRYATIDVAAAPGCSRCAEGRGCGAGLLQGPGRSRQYEASVDDRLQLVVGDRVQLKLRPGSLLGAAMHAYGAPLVGAVVAAAVAHGMALGDAEAAAASLAGMAIGTFASRLHIQRPACLARYVARIERVL